MLCKVERAVGDFSYLFYYYLYDLNPKSDKEIDKLDVVAHGFNPSTAGG